MIKQLVAAIDLGGTNTVFGLVDKEGNIILKESIPTAHFQIPEDMAAVVSEHIKLAMEKFEDQYELVGVGIGAPNGNYYKGTIEYAPNLVWQGIVPLAKLFTDKLNVKTVLTNDANAVALGEMMFGGAKGMKDYTRHWLGQRHCFQW
jgi:glucokinase